jgi:HK97 family phage prohead protease
MDPDKKNLITAAFDSLIKVITATENDYKSLVEKKNFTESRCLYVKSINIEKRQIEAVVSDSSLDRYDEIIMPEAFREFLADYLAKNPVVITSHQNRLDTGHSSVIAQVIKGWINIEGLHVIIWFAETELGNEYWYLYSNKFQRAFSVGFIPLDWKYEDREGNKIRIYTRVELLEISCVPIGANRNALSREYSEMLQDFKKQNDLKFTKLQSFIEQQLDEVKSLLIADPNGLSRGLLLDEDLDDLPDERGEGNNIEQSLERIQNSFKENSNA